MDFLRVSMWALLRSAWRERAMCSGVVRIYRGSDPPEATLWGDREYGFEFWLGTGQDDSVAQKMCCNQSFQHRWLLGKGFTRIASGELISIP